MRNFAKIAAFAGLLTALQLGGPIGGGWAQVDPCEPVPIPGLCEDLDPSPGPGATDDPGGGGSGGGNGTNGGGGGSHEAGDGGKGGGGKARIREPATAPFVLGGSNDSSRLVAILKKLEPRVPVRGSILKVVGPFPVAGLSYWSNDWHACRDGCSRFHEGLDIFAKEGTPLVAIADGVVSQKLVGDLSGISVEITDAHGIQYFYAHMSKWAPGIRVGQSVEQGQVVGYMGHTGNALYTPSHLHLEVQPGGIPVPPKPFVDRWLKIAEEEALRLVAGKSGVALPAPSDFRLTRLFDLAGGGGDVASGSDELLALAGFQPSVSSLEIARRLLDQMAWEIDWSDRTDVKLAALVAEYGRLLEEADLAGASPWAPFGSGTADQEVHEAGD